MSALQQVSREGGRTGGGLAGEEGALLARWAGAQEALARRS